MRIAEKAARILLTVIGLFGLAVFFLPKIGISVDIVMSGSMEPTLKTGGIVFTDTKRTEPSVGDIVTFRNAKGKVSHRVVAKQKQSYITKGDANNTEDVSLLEPEQIIGTVILTVPLLGYAAELLKEKTVGMLLLLMIFQELVFLVIEWKGERIEKKAQETNMKKNTVKIMTLAGILCLASVGGVSAYLTDYEKVSNEFTVGKVDIELKEPEWKPEENKKIEPSKVIHKDPQITNTGTNDAFVYMEVSIPMANVEAAAENGERLGKKVQELFYFEAKDSWMQLSVQNTESRRTYTYAYTKILKPQETSEALFDTVKFLNLIEGQLDGQTFEIPVRAYAIQTSYTGGSSDNLSEQIKAAYEKYVNQNKNQDGKVTE